MKTFIQIILLLIINTTVLAEDQVDNLKSKLSIEQEMFKKLEYKNVEQIKAILERMFTLDQEIRANYSKASSSKTFVNVAVQINQFHSEVLKNIMFREGWITISKYGKEAEKHTWMLVQHADHDPLFQASCLFLIENLANPKDSNPLHYAYLYDRVAVKFQHTGMKQKFGTQLYIANNKLELYPYQGTLSEMDTRRKSIGLEPVEQYMNTAKKLYSDVLKDKQETKIK